ncbi:4-oxalomesaconate tautomerase [Nocardia macrotermitis]|uniref:4-oxalomesaconate tautomerase n=1 Tax=Nocardia macrotermitis TaxID=2585198 RepID=A0A7K0D4G4_9NOCA|nr:4-oxalomesaconate tautomerase [Nocardia macrotermitis]MQY20626.1 4-oxalomesaconate tautomerase [Nocardia macrotermitis]
MTNHPDPLGGRAADEGTALPSSADRDGIACVWMRGGTSKGAYFLAADLPADPAARDDLLLRVMGSPDPRQLDGIGGATSLTSKVAVVSPSERPGIDVDYLFLQLGVDQPTVSDRQNCGNILAGVGQFAVESGLVPASGESCSVRIHLVNSDSTATATFPVRDGRPVYDGDTSIDGVPGTAAPVTLAFEDTAGSATSGLFPTGKVRDTVEGIEITCVDNGMPVVVTEAASFGLTGYESPAELAADTALAERVDRLRRAAAELMGMGDVAESSVPKTILLAPARDGGRVCTRSFIPVRPHTSLGVFAAISAVTAMTTPGAVGHDIAAAWPADLRRVDVEHPSGHLLVDIDLDHSVRPPLVRSAGVVRTARKLFAGKVFPRA